GRMIGAPELGERAPQLARLGLGLTGVEVTHRPDDARRRQAARTFFRFDLRLGHFSKLRVIQVVPARPALPAPAEAAHPALDVEEESLALLLAVAHDVEAAIDLALDHSAHGGEAGALDFACIHGIAPDTPPVHLQ